MATLLSEVALDIEAGEEELCYGLLQGHLRELAERQPVLGQKMDAVLYRLYGATLSNNTRHYEAQRYSQKAMEECRASMEECRGDREEVARLSGDRLRLVG